MDGPVQVRRWNPRAAVIGQTAAPVNQAREESNMKTRQLKGTVALLALAAGTTLALGAEPTLKVGDKAPKLQTGKWVQGEPVKEFQKVKDPHAISPLVSAIALVHSNRRVASRFSSHS